MEQRRLQRAGALYDFLDNSRLFHAHALPGARSEMNVTFRTDSPELDAEFVKGAAARGLLYKEKRIKHIKFLLESFQSLHKLIGITLLNKLLLWSGRFPFSWRSV